MIGTICRICLRSGFERTADICEALMEFHDELCDYDVDFSTTLTICPICEHLLRKFYNFKQKCQRAHKILKTTKKKDLKEMGIEKLQTLIPNSLGNSKRTDRQAIVYVVEYGLCQAFNDTPTVILTPENNLYAEFNNKNAENVAAEENVNLNPCVKPDKVNFSSSIELDLELDPKTETHVKTEVDTDDPISVTQSNVLDPMLDTPRDDLDPVLDTHDDILTEFKVEEDDISESDSFSNDLNEQSDEYLEIKCVEKIAEESVLNDVKLDNYKNKNKAKCDLKEKVLRKTKEKILKRQVKINCKKETSVENLKEYIIWLLEQGEIDLGENVTLTKERFVDMFEKYDVRQLEAIGMLKRVHQTKARIKNFLLKLMDKYNPEFESVFEIQYMTTEEEKRAEFENRKFSKEYLQAEYKCDVCFKGFQLKGILEYHMNWHDARLPHACEYCGMRYTSQLQLNRHYRTSHTSLFRCKLCHLLTYNFGAMKNHYQQHKGVRYACEICLGEYSSRSCLNTHLLSHARHECSRCKRRFISEKGLHNHVRFKHPDHQDAPAHGTEVPRLYKCRYINCLLTFDTALELRGHVADSGHVRRGGGREGCFAGRRNSYHYSPSPSKRPVIARAPKQDKPAYRTCPICQEKVANKSGVSLYRHHMLRHPQLPYPRSAGAAPAALCELCGKSFLHYSVYKDHLNVHSGVKPYACPQCGARFSMGRHLHAHSERHKGPRHHCKDCGKKFLTGANLNSHRRAHIGDRRYRCEMCSKGFLHAGSLKEHIRGVHQNIRRTRRTSKTK